MTTKPQSTTTEEIVATLLPCPFCGSVPETGITGAPECDNWRYVKCSNNYCSIRHSLFTVKSWNTRISPASAAPVVDENSVVFAAYNQAIEDAKQAIRDETWAGSDAAPSFINAIARRCSPHVYVNRLVAAATAAPVEQSSETKEAEDRTNVQMGK